MSTHIAEVVSGWRIRTAVLLALLLALVAVFVFQQSAKALEFDSMAVLQTEQSTDAVVSGGSSSTNISAELLRLGDELTDTNALNSTVANPEAIETERVFSAWAGQRIVFGNAIADSATTINNDVNENALPSSDASGPDVGIDATVLSLISNEGIFGNDGSFAIVLLIAAFMVVAVTHGLRLWSFRSFLGGFGSSPRGRTDLSTTDSASDHMMGSPASAHNGSGGEAHPASGRPSFRSDAD